LLATTKRAILTMSRTSIAPMEFPFQQPMRADVGQVAPADRVVRVDQVAIVGQVVGVGAAVGVPVDRAALLKAAAGIAKRNTLE
jgi:hypothetical protein